MRTHDCWHYWEAADRSFTCDEWAAWCRDKDNDGATVERYGFHFNDADVCRDPHALISIRLPMGGRHIPAELDVRTFRGRGGRWGFGVWSLFAGSGSTPGCFSRAPYQTEEEALEAGARWAENALEKEIGWYSRALANGSRNMGYEAEKARAEKFLAILREKIAEHFGPVQLTLFPEDALC